MPTKEKPEHALVCQESNDRYTHSTRMESPLATTEFLEHS